MKELDEHDLREVCAPSSEIAMDFVPLKTFFIATSIVCNNIRPKLLFIEEQRWALNEVALNSGAQNFGRSPITRSQRGTFPRISTDFKED